MNLFNQIHFIGQTFLLPFHEGDGGDGGGDGGQGDGGEGDGGTGDQSAVTLFDSLPDDQKSLDILKPFSSAKSNEEALAAMVKSYGDTKSHVGNSVKLPAHDAPEEEVAKFYDKLRPEKPEQYEFTKPEGVEEDEGYQGRLDNYKNFAHENGWTQKQFSNTMEFIQGLVDKAKAEEDQAWENERSKSEAALKADPAWRGTLFEQNKRMVQDTVEKIFGPMEESAFRQFADKTGISNHPEYLKGMKRVSEFVQESSRAPGDPPPELNKQTAQAEIDAIKGNKGHKYYDAYLGSKPDLDPELIKEAKAYMNNLYSIVSAE